MEGLAWSRVVSEGWLLVTAVPIEGWPADMEEAFLSLSVANKHQPDDISQECLTKIDSMFKPFPTVLGSRAEADPKQRPENPFSYGYTRLPPGLILRPLRGGGPAPEERMPASLTSVLRSEPTGPEAGGGATLRGSHRPDQARRGFARECRPFSCGNPIPRGHRRAL